MTQIHSIGKIVDSAEVLEHVAKIIIIELNFID